MFTHRTNVLLTPEENRLLSHLSTKKGVTKSALIRHAINQTYKTKQPASSLSQILKSGWKLLQNPQKSLNYKQLIEYGRRS